MDRTFRVNAVGFLASRTSHGWEFWVGKRHESELEFPGLWETFGGGVKWIDHIRCGHESPDGGKEGTLFEALCREAREELGIDIRGCRHELLNDFSYERGSDGQKVIGLRCLIILPESRRGEVRPKAHSVGRWVTARELDELMFLGNVAHMIVSIDQDLRARGFEADQG